MDKAGCFVLISRMPDDEKVTDEHILRTYQEQTVAEPHFTFIKDPKIVGPVYMKSPNGWRLWPMCFS